MTSARTSLRRYIHCLREIRRMSVNDPTVKFSYGHMAGLHNLPGVFDQACQHWNFKFHPWHRAHMLNYEDALRAVDPDVAIPYWDWTKHPTGNRFPVAFENDADPVEAHYGERIDPSDLAVLFNDRRRTASSGAPYTWRFILDILKARNNGFFGDMANHGPLENPPHDDMHGFIGGDLVRTSTAADDPIFWSFHTFIDLLWWHRQSLVTGETHPAPLEALNGMERQTAFRSDAPVQVDETLGDIRDLGYDYEFTPPPSPVVLAADETLIRKLPRLAKIAGIDAAAVVTLPMDKMQLADSKVVVRLEGQFAPSSVAYVGLVYLFPGGIEFDYANPDFQERYLVSHFARFIDERRKGRDGVQMLPIDLSAYSELETDAPMQIGITIHATSKPQPNLTADNGTETPLSEEATHRTAGEGREFRNYAEVNAWLLDRCIAWAKAHPHPEARDKTIWEMFETERPSLVPYAGPFDGFHAIPASISKTCLVRFDSNRYSVCASAVGRPVEIRAYAERIELWQDGRVVGRHERVFGRGKTVYDPWHYVPALVRKPGALRNGAPFKDWVLPSSLKRVRRKLGAVPNGDRLPLADAAHRLPGRGWSISSAPH